MKQVLNLNLASTFEEFRKEIFLTFNSHRIGIIQDFDSATQTATIKLVDKRVISTYEGTILKDYSPLIRCPVMVYAAGDGWIDTPIVSGDECQIHFNDRNIDNWYETGQIQAPDSNRAHDLQDGIATIGLHSKQKSIMDFDITAFGFRRGAGGTSKIQISSDQKIDIRNAAQDLKTLIDSFITIIKNLKAQNGASLYPIDAPTSLALDALKIQFDSLLK